MKAPGDLPAWVLVTVTTLATFALVCNVPKVGAKQVTESLYKEFKSAAVATSVGPCSTIGKRILKKGGSVVDAAIAACLCVGIHHPQSSGIGGGFFMNYYDAATGNGYFINSREVAPLAGHKDMYNFTSLDDKEGPQVIAVPGEIAGYWEAHQRFGKIGWSELFKPSIRLAAKGIQVGEYFAALTQERERRFGISDDLKSIVNNPDGSLKKEGDNLVRPALAATLRIIAKYGASSFYNGSLAKRILKDIRDATGVPSLITKKDLQNYRTQVKSLMNFTLGDLTLLIPGSPSSGPVLSLILNILEGYNFTSRSTENAEAKTLTYHRVIEAFKFAYGNRMQLGDGDFNPEISKFIKTMISKDYAESLRMKINDFKTEEKEYYMPDFANPPDDHGTSHLCVLGEDGSAVAMTSTVNILFGSGVVGKRTGILFNNEMADFTLPGANKSSNNFIEPGKRPLSSMTPTIILESRPEKTTVKMVVGASGGTSIITGAAQVILNQLWLGKGLDKSVAAKRFHHQLSPNAVELDPDFDKDIMERLKAKGHDITGFGVWTSAVQAIYRLRNGKIAARSDQKKKGYPDGY